MAGTDQSGIMKAVAIPQYQGVEIRFISCLIDIIVVLLFNTFLVILIGVVGAIFGSSFVSGTDEMGFFLFLIIFLGYFTYLEGSKGQTIGKMVTKIKVVRDDGGMISLNQAFVRSILLLIDAGLIGAILIWTSKKNQRLGDRIAKTVVVKV